MAKQMTLREGEQIVIGKRYKIWVEFVDGEGQRVKLHCDDMQPFKVERIPGIAVDIAAPSVDK